MREPPADDTGHYSDIDDGTADAGTAGGGGGAPGAACGGHANRETRRRARTRRGRRGAPVKLLLRVDWDTFLRGAPTDGEVCELVGYGPVSMGAVRELLDLGDPFVAAIVRKGTSLVGVAHLGRQPTAHQRSALEWLYPSCAVQGCAHEARLEIDHRLDWSKSPMTVLTFSSSGPELDALSRIGGPFFKPRWRPDIVGMVLDASVDWGEVAELPTESYCLLAATKLSESVKRPS